MTPAQPARESMPPVAPAHDKILIVDFGSQVTQLIARRVREEGVYSEIVPFQKAEAAFREMQPKAVILSGGPESVHEAGSPRAPQAIFDSGGRPPSGIRPRRRGGKGREPAVRRDVGFGRAASGLDEPRRSYHQNAAGI